MVTQMTPLRLFCGYAHEDEALLNQLKKTLAVPIRQETITVWHDREMLAGTEWDAEIEYNLHTADIILLLISPNFISSEYCWNREMQWAITRHKTGDAQVVPILLKPTPGWETTPLGKLLALPRNAKPVTIWKNRNQAFANIAEELLKLIHSEQSKDNYSIYEYAFGLHPTVYENAQNATLAQKLANLEAEQWLKTISESVRGNLNLTDQSNDQKEWQLTDQQHTCRIVAREYKGMDISSHPFRSADIIVTSQHPTFIHRLIAAGKTPYWFLQWTINEDLDIDFLQKQFYERGGNNITHSSTAESFKHIEYTFYRDMRLTGGTGKHIRVTFSSRGSTSRAKIGLIYDNGPFGGFYQMHKLISISKIFSALSGNIAHKQIRQLIEEACTKISSDQSD